VSCTWRLKKLVERERRWRRGEEPRPKRNEIWAVYLKRGGDRFEIQMPMLVSWKGWKEEIGGRQGKKGVLQNSNRKSNRNLQKSNNNKEND
jgi:hypothetical protein